MLRQSTFGTEGQTLPLILLLIQHFDCGFHALEQRWKKHSLTFALAKTTWMAFIAPRLDSMRISVGNLPLVKLDMVINPLLIASILFVKRAKVHGTILPLYCA